MGRNETNSLSFLHIAMAKTIKGLNKTSLQRADLKKTFFEVLTREFSGNTPKTCDRFKECRRLFHMGKR